VRSYPSWVLFVSYLALYGCQAKPPTPPQNVSSQAPTTAQQVTNLLPDPGFKPLVTPQQVINSLEYGRENPFAPPEGVNNFGFGRDAVRKIIAANNIKFSSTAESITTRYEGILDLEGFDYTGFIGAGKSARLFISYNGRSAEYSVRSKESLSNLIGMPPGWNIAAFDPRSGAIKIANDGISVTLYPGSTKQQLDSVFDEVDRILLRLNPSKQEPKT